MEIRTGRGAHLVGSVTFGRIRVKTHYDKLYKLSRKNMKSKKIIVLASMTLDIDCSKIGVKQGDVYIDNNNIKWSYDGDNKFSTVPDMDTCFDTYIEFLTFLE